MNCVSTNVYPFDRYFSLQCLHFLYVHLTRARNETFGTMKRLRPTDKIDLREVREHVEPAHATSVFGSSQTGGMIDLG
jgi:hypothetical protein